MSRTLYDHVHSYRALNERMRMYKCTLVGCPHTNNAAALEGQRAKCPKCKNTIVITKEHLRRVIIGCIGECPIIQAPAPEIVALLEKIHPVTAKAESRPVLSVTALLAKMGKTA